jgi:3-deoxy-manno-octulosonate cytidylyltransferase (CMP-KDO synthetase)
MNIIAIIPARMGSSRFPGKPLAPIHGVPLVGHVYFRTKLNRRLSAVYIATCDEEIRQYASQIGADWVMTSPTHVRASDRTAEAVEIIERRTGRRVDVVVMVQGDEPMIVPAMIDEAVQPLVDDPAVQVVNLMAPIDADAAADPNEVKVAVDRRGCALYFSRHPLPWQARTPAASFKQVCVIPFRRPFLSTFAALEPTPLEQAESIDMLRALEHGWPVRMAPTTHATYSVDTPADLARVSGLMRGDPLLSSYGGASWQKSPAGRSSSLRPTRVRASIATGGRSRRPAATSSPHARPSGSRRTTS